MPLEDEVFFDRAKQADLFPLNIVDSIAKMDSRRIRVTYFLKHVVEPRPEEYLHKLLKMMKQSKFADAEKLAGEILAAVERGMYTLTYVHLKYVDKSFSTEIIIIYYYSYISMLGNLQM